MRICDRRASPGWKDSEMNDVAISFLKEMSELEVRIVAYEALNRLSELEEVGFRVEDECFYWTSCGDDLLN